MRILRCVSSQVVAVVEPGLTRTRISLQEDGAEVAFLTGTGGVEDLPPLLRLTAASFDIDVWQVEVGGFQRMVLQSPEVVSTCEALGITLEPLEPRPAEG